MTWRAEHGGYVLGLADSREEAQLLARRFDLHPFAFVTDEETGERWILRADGWVETVRAPVAPRRYRADIDG